MSEIVVVGGGVAGLGTALALGRSGHHVTVLERDHAPLPDSPDAAFATWDRRGVPQARHSHGFLARLRNTLRDRAPDVLADLLAAGATEMRFTENMPPEILDRTPRDGDEDLVALASRRITFEWVLRHAVAREPSVSFRDGVHLTGLVGTPDAVTGVAVDGGAFDADLVVDAMGRRSPLATWLEAIGAPAPEDETVECGVIYLTRFYRLRDGQEPPPQTGPIGGDLGYIKYAVFLGDNRTFSVTFATNTDDETMRPKLLHNDAFDAAARALPATAAWVEPQRSEPITDVAVMARLVNRRRKLVVDGEPVVLGVIAVGDAAIHTNPLYGRGCPLGLVQAWMLADLIGEVGLDHRALALAFEEGLQREIDPWYRASVMQDLQNQGKGDGGGDEIRTLLRDGLFPATRTDPEVFRAFLRVFNLLDPPDAVMSNGDIVARVMKVWQERDQRPEPPAEGPTEDEMLEILRRAEAA